MKKMRVVKEEQKITVPLFPRLHVKDATDKGGRRPPPRNKMALYEQLSVPSKRLKHAPVPSLPVPKHRAGDQFSKLTSASASQGHERKLCSSYHTQSYGPTNASDKFLPNDEMPLNSPRVELETRSAEETTHWPHNSPAHLRLAAEYSITHSRPQSNLRISYKNCEDEDGFSVPTFVHYGTEENMKEKMGFQEGSSQKNAAVTVNSSSQLQNTNESSNGIRGNLSKSRGSHQSEQKGKEPLTPKPSTKRPKPHERSEGNGSLNSNFGQESPSFAVNLRNPQNGTACILQNDNCCGNFSEPRYLINGGEENGDASKMSTGLASKRSPSNRCGYPTIIGTREDANNVTGFLKPGNMTSDDEASETSILDSISGGLSPDDLVSLLGLKHFWKARRAVINQQRVFAVQVFELHRLIKVQKLIAASPQILLEGNPHLCTTPKVSSKNINSERTANCLLQNTRQNDDSQKEIYRLGSKPITSTTKFALPLPLSENDSNIRPSSRIPQDDCCSGNPSLVPVAFENGASSWHVQPSGSQWLVPVISPTEGLIYKPVAVPCPATAAVIGSFGRSPMPMPPLLTDFMNPSYAVPASQQQKNMSILPSSLVVATNNFPASYGLPVVNPFISAAAAEQAGQCIRTQPGKETEQPSHNSGNVVKQKCEAVLPYASRIQTSRVSDLQGSTGSSSSEGVHERGHASNSLPPASGAENLDSRSQTDGRDQWRHIVKVVPHDSSFATESAAEIFRFIQKERKRY